MRSYYPVIFAVTVSSIISGSILLLLRFLHREWWRKKQIRFAAIGMAVSGLLSIFIWATGIIFHMRPIAFVGAISATTIFLLQLSLVASLPFSAIILLFSNLFSYLKNRRLSMGRSDPAERRGFLKRSAAILPAIVISGQTAGIVNSFKKITIPVIKLPVVDLPDSLRGLKIAHLSDSHLGYFTTLDDLEDATDEIIEHAPDMVLITGDISDDLTILPDAIRIISSIRPPLGIFASVGNHEYYRGIETVKKIFEKSDFPLLVNENVIVRKNNATIIIGGADDPVSLRKVSAEFLVNSIDKTMDGAPTESFKILMSHRPRGLNHASTLDVDLVLAGHTHGAQIGFSGRSAFEAVLPEIYLWGIYRKNNTVLYTSSGMGHWMPFRLGCPAEAPILVLDSPRNCMT